MDVVEALTGRRSQHRLGEPTPDDRELARLVQIAAAAPDHGQLRPWRLVIQRGATRVGLGRALATDSDRPETALGKPLRAPLLVAIIFCPAGGTRIPEWEQLAATAAVVFSLSLVLHAHGWGSIWRTGNGVNSTAVRRFMSLAQNERLLGWLYIGTPEPGHAPAPRTPVDLAEKLSGGTQDLANPIAEPVAGWEPARCTG